MGTQQPEIMWSVCWILVCLLTGVSGVLDISEGGAIDEDVTVRAYDTPLFIKSSLFVRKDRTLTLEPGVELRFAPGAMLAVNGTLIARGNAQNRIKLTKDPNFGKDVPNWPADIRLVDDRTVNRGRLQMLYKKRWRGVCANFQNWTQADTNVACRQLGFKNGTFEFHSFAKNDSVYMLYHKPGCTENESHLNRCPGYRKIKIGSRICQNQQTVHLECEGLAPNVAKGNWWGLEFYNSSHFIHREGSIRINKSASVLEYVDVLYAGVDSLGKPTGAVRASPLPPILKNVVIKYSALDGANFTEIRSSTDIKDSVFSENRGHGIAVESLFGRVTIANSVIRNNAGNGIKTKFLDEKWPVLDLRNTFCRVSAQSSNTYPIVRTAIPDRTYGSPCTNIFRTKRDYIITLNIVEMTKVEDASGTLTIYDGDDVYYTKIVSIALKNNTMLQGISSTRPAMRLVFEWDRLPKNCRWPLDCIKFTIIVDTGPATVPEFVMTRTEVSNNIQHGALIENARNYIYINESVMSHNGYGAGLNILGGAADVHVNASKLNYNKGNGVNITHDGGWRIFNESSFSHNEGIGINITLNETMVDNRTRLAKHQKTEVWKSELSYNDESGLRVGNYCRSCIHNVNDSMFVENGKDGIIYESCFKIITDKNISNFTAGWNTFAGNRGHGIRIQPLINAVGRIGNNTFKDHSRHTLLIDNGDDYLRLRDYFTMIVDMEITSNQFTNNRGFYVANLRLTQGSNRQKLAFKHNTLRNNDIEGAFPTLNARTRSYAVVIVSSDNVNVSRNYLVNPNAQYEVSTHLLQRNAIVEITRNWWGTTDYNQIILRIFDQFNRYDLARLQYHPVLEYEDDLYGNNEDYVTNRQRPEEVKFHRGDVLGGRLTYSFITELKKKKVPTATLR